MKFGRNKNKKTKTRIIKKKKEKTMEIPMITLVHDCNKCNRISDESVGLELELFEEQLMEIVSSIANDDFGHCKR